jgi:hypothetical protein
MEQEGVMTAASDLACTIAPLLLIVTAGAFGF